jgi:hypothetical protein
MELIVRKLSVSEDVDGNLSASRVISSGPASGMVPGTDWNTLDEPVKETLVCTDLTIELGAWLLANRLL